MLNCTGTCDLDRSDSHSCNHALQKDNLPEPFYTLELSLNLIELNPAYPREPHTLGEHIRKARMDRRLMIKELAALVGVSEDTVINWEKRGVKPMGKSLRRLQEALEGIASAVGGP